MRKLVLVAGLGLLCSAGLMAQTVQGVRTSANPLQIGVGYSFVSFYETPNTTLNSSGVTASAVFYRDALGVEANVSDDFGSQGGKSTQLLFAGGGVRFRLLNRFSFVPWAHAVVGYSHLSPQPSFGGDSAVGYKVGGGADFNPRHSRIGYRVSADLLGSHFFNTYQLSPEISVGIFFGAGRD